MFHLPSLIVTLIIFVIPLDSLAQSRISIGNGLECQISDSSNALFESDRGDSLSFSETRKKLQSRLKRLNKNPSANRNKILNIRSTIRNLRACELQDGSYAPNLPTPTPISSPIPGGAIIATHEAAAAYDYIPQSIKNLVLENFNIYYGHTSHGSQILSGLQMLAATSNPPILGIFTEEYGDLGHYGDTSWASTTREYLRAHPNTNIVMWSWCGGVSDNTPAGIDSYLSTMNRLEEQFPNVKFVYMTGHLDGSGDGGTLRELNNRIREYCKRYGKILFDFEDIESFDPDGGYYANASDTCEWCGRWCSDHTCPSASICGINDCAHSHCFNCYRKAKAWWWMMGRIAGWQG